MVSTKLLAVGVAFNLLGTSQAVVKVCQEYDIDLSITSNVTSFNYPHWTTNFGLQDFLTQAISRTAMTIFLPKVFKDVKVETRSVTIHGTICSPKNTRANEKKLLLATHGIGFDSRYWNILYKRSTYNFVDYAVNQGYSVFFYDRLGVGKSQRISGFLNQPSIEAAVLKELTLALRAGKYTGSKLGVPSKIIYVGHSFGSELSHNIAATNPGIVDGLVLTGIDYNKDIISPSLIIAGQALRVAKLVNPKAFSSFDAGYTADVDIYEFQQDFFRYPFDREALKYAFATAQPASILENLLQMSLIVDASSVTIPVLVVSAEFDFFFCSGDCRGVTEAAANATYPNSSNFEFYQVPGAGHGINFAPRAPNAYKAIGAFLRHSF